MDLAVQSFVGLIHPEDGGRKFLLNVPNNLPTYTITHPRNLDSSPTHCD
jgi:hypothetical protein